MPHIGKMRVSSRGKFIEYAGVTPRTQRESFPRQLECLCVCRFRVLAQPLSSLDLWVLWGVGCPRCAGRWQVILAERAGGPSQPSSNFLTDGAGRMAAGQSEGRLNPVHEGHYPLAQLQLSGLCKQMVPSATRIIGGRFSAEVNYLPSLPTDR